MSIRRAAIVAVFAAAQFLHATEVAACSRGPAIPLTQEEQAARDERALRDSEVIVEMTIISQLHDTPRSQECRGILEEHEFACSGVSDESCDALRDRFLERCAFIDTAARANVTAVWKGQIQNGDNLVNFEVGGFRRMNDSGGSCFGPIELLPGDQLVFCGNMDDSGELVGVECSSSPEHHSYREKWQALRKAAAAQPENLDAQIALATFLEEWNDRTGALTAYHRISQLSPNDPLGYVGPGRIQFAYQQKKEHGDPRYDEAIALFHHALDLDPTNTEAHGYLNRIRFLKGDVVDAALVDFEGLHFYDRKLENLDLRGKNFAGAVLSRVSFKGSKLDNADFTDASLNDVDFTDASLRNAIFDRSPKVTYSDQTKFNLQQFAGADLTGARFGNAVLNLDTSFSQVPVGILKNSKLPNAQLFCGYLSRHESSEIDTGSWSQRWPLYLENLRTVREIARTQVVRLSETCSNAIIHYLSLPDDCQPWLPAHKRSAACTFME